MNHLSHNQDCSTLFQSFHMSAGTQPPQLTNDFIVLNSKRTDLREFSPRGYSSPSFSHSQISLVLPSLFSCHSSSSKWYAAKSAPATQRFRHIHRHENTTLCGGRGVFATGMTAFRVCSFPCNIVVTTSTMLLSSVTVARHLKIQCWHFLKEDCFKTYAALTLQNTAT